MAGDELPVERLREFLRELKPEARSLLLAELERGLLRGENPPAAGFILDELRAQARDSGRTLARVGNAARLYFAPLEPFLVDDASERKHRGRVSRSCLEPVWQWLARDLMPVEV